MTDECPGVCNRAYRRARQQYHEADQRYLAALDDWQHDRLDVEPEPPDEPDLEPTLGDPVWCARCVAIIRKSLSELDDLAAILAASSDGHRGQNDGEPVSGSSNDPSPSPAADTIDALYGTLTEVEDHWREARGYQPRPPRSGRGAHALTTCVAWLLRHLDEILQHSGSVEFGLAVLNWHKVLQHLTKTQRETTRKPAPCPRCDQRTMIKRLDDGYIECRNCGRLMTDTEYEQLVTTALREVS